MRAFIAIELSESIKNSLSQVQSHLKYAGADVKWIERGNIHLTLKFLGEINEEKLQPIKMVLNEITKLFSPFEITLKNTGAFPNIENPRVLWMRMDKGAKKSSEIAGLIDEELSKIGFGKESRPFAAHLTIGRVRSARNKEALAGKLSAMGHELPAGDQLVTSLTLFQSTLTPGGAVYTKLYEVKLK